MLILLYHGVRPDEDTHSPDIRMKHTPRAAFVKQLRLLQSLGTPFALSEIVSRLQHGIAIPKRGFCITFDDGYQNNAAVAAPILKELGIPATFFITTGFIDLTTTLWVDRFETAYAALPHQTETDSAFRTRLKRMSPAERNSVIQKLESQSGTTNTIHPLHRPMTWDNIRALTRDGFEIGAHTVTHPILSTLSTEEQRQEIIGSKNRIEAETRLPCRSFAYPNGQPQDWTTETETLIKDAGYASSLTTIDGPVLPSDGLFAIRRTTIDTDSMGKFGLTITGIRSTLHHLRTSLRV